MRYRKWGFSSISNKNKKIMTLRGMPGSFCSALGRYAKQDPVDCVAVLRLGVAQYGIRWTLASLELEQWIM